MTELNSASANDHQFYVGEIVQVPPGVARVIGAIWKGEFDTFAQVQPLIPLQNVRGGHNYANRQLPLDCLKPIPATNELS